MKPSCVTLPDPWIVPKVRQVMVLKIAKRIYELKLKIAKTPTQIEQRVFEKSHSKEQYFLFAARLFALLNKHHNKQEQQQQQRRTILRPINRKSYVQLIQQLHKPSIASALQHHQQTINDAMHSKISNNQYPINQSPPPSPPPPPQASLVAFVKGQTNCDTNHLELRHQFTEHLAQIRSTLNERACVHHVQSEQLPNSDWKPHWEEPDCRRKVIEQLGIVLKNQTSARMPILLEKLIFDRVTSMKQYLSFAAAVLRFLVTNVTVTTATAVASFQECPSNLREIILEMLRKASGHFAQLIPCRFTPEQQEAILFEGSGANSKEQYVVRATEYAVHLTEYKFIGAVERLLADLKESEAIIAVQLLSNKSRSL